MQPPLPVPRPGPDPADDRAAARVLQDSAWPGNARAALASAGSLLATCLIVDATARSLSPLHVLGWTALAALLLVILLPARVSAAPGVLTVRGLCVTRAVRTDRLAFAAWPKGTERRLLLRDESGARAEIELQVLLSNPALWLRLEEDIGAARALGTLHHGAADLERLARHIDVETTRALLQVSGLG